ncbi:hypothetical protein TNCT_138551 [Trichonephila clavata]|uniref:Uncharacterized protein n=1 Tax=Trichonephila clavata TaxID=2740835 RepID=A0A8X6HVE8_TRICU|nr:hypothetical protein TNCT_138551 [Trichonephila clavata]
MPKSCHEGAEKSSDIPDLIPSSVSDVRCEKDELPFRRKPCLSEESISCEVSPCSTGSFRIPSLPPDAHYTPPFQSFLLWQ